MNAEQHLFAILENCQPRTIVVCGELALSVAERWAEGAQEPRITQLNALDPNRAFPLSHQHDLALVTETLERLPHEEGELLLGQLRNFGARQIAVLMADSEAWRFSDFIGLGFKRHERFDGHPPLALYTYDIRNYNHKRTWNNPKYWANPEMWDKARW